MTTTTTWARSTCVAQVHQHLRGWELVERHGTTYRLTEAFHELIQRLGGLGAVYGLFRTDPWTGRDLRTGIPAEVRGEVAALLQDAVRDASGGIGVLLVTDAPHGEMSHGCITLPPNLAQAASWSPELVRAGADAVGRAARADGTHLVLCSGLDVLRDGRWGRSEETYGEDPLLSARLVAAQVTGLQGGHGLHPRTHPGAVVKHFAGQGGAMGGLNAGSAALGAAEFAEIHLPPAEAAVQAGAVGMMAAYNDVDGICCVGHRDLLTGLLREQWGFDGIVMADALAVDRLAENLGPRQAAFTALAAGCDLNLGDACWDELTEPGDAAGERALERAATRIRRLKEAFGLLPGQSEATPDRPPEEDVLHASHAMAQAAITSLGEPGQPVGPQQSVLVVGPFVDSVESLLGDYSTPLSPGRFASMLEEARTRFPRAITASWDADAICRAAQDVDVVLVQLGGTSERIYGEEFAHTGANLASTPFLGATCGEGMDVADLGLPHGQDDVLRALRGATAGRIIGVAVMGRPHVLTTARAVCDDLLVAWYPGPFGAAAILDVVTGRTSATGRLPVTLPAHTGSLGWHDNDRVGDVPPQYVDLPEPLVAGFGDGGGVSGIEPVGTLRLERGNGYSTARVTVRSPCGGSEVIRLFGRRSGGLRWPRRRILLDFTRVDLAPGEQRDVTFTLDDRDVFGLGPTPSGLAADDATTCTLTVAPFGISVEVVQHEGD